MRAGKLRHRLTIQEPTDTVGDTYGDATITWSDYATVWGSVTPLRGQEQYQADQVQAGVTHRVTMRYRVGITSKMRISHNGRVLSIMSVIDREDRNIELELMCMEEVE